MHKVVLTKIIFCLFKFRDCPGVGTSSGSAGKEVSYHGAVGGSGVGYKATPQHSSQSRGPPPHFPQELPTGPPANSPPLHINICGQVHFFLLLFFESVFSRESHGKSLFFPRFQENNMRVPLLNMSPGLGASGVDMEYRRNSQCKWISFSSNFFK